MDDSIILSRRIVQDDDFDEHQYSRLYGRGSRDQTGNQKLSLATSPMSVKSLRHLDEEGIVRVGAEVKAGDVLVGKITPKVSRTQF